MRQRPNQFSPSRGKLFSFTWYHREELQVLILLVGLIIFFSRELWVLFSLAGFLLVSITGLYVVRILELWLSKHNKAQNFVEGYRTMKQALHGHSVERSRIAMAVLACVVSGCCVCTVLILPTGLITMPHRPIFTGYFFSAGIFGCVLFAADIYSGCGATGRASIRNAFRF